MNLAQRAVLFAVALVLASCGVAYVLEPARFVLKDSGSLSRQKVLFAVGAILKPQGFDDLGTDEEMLNHLESNHVVEDSLITYSRNRFTYLNRQRNLSVEVLDYTDRSLKRPPLAFEAPDGPFFEVAVYEQRPGGFSPEGRVFVSALQKGLEHTLTATVTLVTPPPAPNPDEFRRVKFVNGLAMAFQWALAFLVTIFITGGVTRYALKRTSLSSKTKRGIFVLVNTWLATPLTFPAALSVIVLPNLFAFPWLDAVYFYAQVKDVAAVSFPLTLVLCFVVARRTFPAASPKAIEA